MPEGFTRTNGDKAITILAQALKEHREGDLHIYQACQLIDGSAMESPAVMKEIINRFGALAGMLTPDSPAMKRFSKALSKLEKRSEYDRESEETNDN